MAISTYTNKKTNSYSAIAKITNVSEGAIGTELKVWREELTKFGRTIQDEQANHRTERIRKAEPTNDNFGIGIDIPQTKIPIELELVR